ncbi:uncharacterized protein CDAR_13341 [Caerostris darwini]|uniref:Ionotropic glutamate receptor L-glutamate and glycine-binding domain-containing protein n=1 Tax=Caerostris darwini TaxID=1538125 RepID=A0AAV4R0C3_9ARAC|nr:uncharacterized protein CDAR_13341 [Caerostris darwini]
MKFPDFLRIAIVTKAGLFDYHVTDQNETIIVGGTEKRFLEMLSEKLKFKYKVYVPPDGEWGTLKNNTWTGVIGMVHYGKADIAIGKISITEERRTAVNFSYPYDVEDLTFSTKAPGYLSKTTAFASPFDSYIWYIFILLTIIFLIVFRICQEKKRPFQRIVLKFLGYLVLQPLDIFPITARTKVLVVSWLLGGRFISFFYSAALLAFLTIPEQEQGIKTISQLSNAISKGSIKSVTFKGASYTSTLMNNRQEMVHIIADHIRKNNFLIDPSKEASSQAMKDGKTAVIASRKHEYNQ